MKQRVGVDCDGVLCRFNEAYIARLAFVTGRDLFPYGYEPHCWDYPTAQGYTKAELRRVWDTIVNDPTFWQDLLPYPDARAALQELGYRARWGTDVYFITARPGSTAKEQTERWIRTFSDGCVTPTVLISADKAGCASALDLDHYIDDRWENAYDVASTTKTRSYLLTQPWNVTLEDECHGITRVRTMDDFFTALGGVTP